MTPEPTRQRLCTSKPATTVPPIAFYGPDRPTLPWHQPQSQRVLLAFNPSWVRATELIAEMTVDISSTLQYLTYRLIA
jgi:hypothetical protein